MRLKMDGGDLYDTIQGASKTGNVEGVIKLKEDRWLLKSVDESNVMMFAALVPGTAMDYYKPGDQAEIGISFEKLLNAVGSKSDPVELELYQGKGTHKLKVIQNGYEAGVGLINTEYISGVTDQTPKVEYAVEIENPLGFVDEFIDRSDDIVGEGAYLMSAREEGFYLYSAGDTDDLVKKVKWSDFDNYSVDWSTGSASNSNGVDPEEDKRCDTMLSVDYSKDIQFMSDNAKLFMDNDTPIKLLFRKESGVTTSYFLSPRLGSEQTVISIPDDTLGMS